MIGTTEHAIYRPERFSANGVISFFGEIFVSLAQNPRVLRVEVDLRETEYSEGAFLDLERGEPVVGQKGKPSAHGCFSGRWLALHDVPLPFGSLKRLLFTPTDSGRIKIKTI